MESSTPRHLYLFRFRLGQLEHVSYSAILTVRSESFVSDKRDMLVMHVSPLTSQSLEPSPMPKELPLGFHVFQRPNCKCVDRFGRSTKPIPVVTMEDRKLWLMSRISWSHARSSGINSMVEYLSGCGANFIPPQPRLLHGRVQRLGCYSR